jgi:hypothetical protein
MNGIFPFAVDDFLQLDNHHIQQFHVLSPLILDSIRNLKLILHGIMHRLTVSFPCTTGRFIGSLDEIRRNLRSFPEKIFLNSSRFTKRKMRETDPSVNTDMTIESGQKGDGDRVQCIP